MYIFGVALAIIAYSCYYLYDFLVVRQLNSVLVKLLFPIGTLFAAGATAFFLLISYEAFSFSIVSVIFLILSVLNFMLMLESLFFCLPKGTYENPEEKRTCYKNKMYGLMRHPGVFFYIFFYLFLWLSMKTWKGLVIIIFLCVLDIVYMILQDIYTFPRTFSDYDEYKKTVPFFIPSLESIKNCISDYFSKENIRK